MNHVGLNRVEAARFVSRRIGHRLLERTLRHWETHGLIRPFKARPGGRGRHCPVVYGLPELLAAEILATLRLEGTSLQRLRRALSTLSRFMPGIAEAPARWRLIVTAKGDVRRVESEADLLELTSKPGQLAFAIFDIGVIAAQAREALKQRARSA